MTERGTTFGYNNLVVDMRGFPIMRETGTPLVFDVTHSLQLPGGAGKSSGGQSRYIGELASAGVACGVDALDKECDTVCDRLSDIEARIIGTPVRTLGGLLEKARVAWRIAAPPRISRRFGAEGGQGGGHFPVDRYESVTEGP